MNNTNSIVTSSLTIASHNATPLIKATDYTMLSENGGHIQLMKTWTYSLLKRIGLVQWKATTKTKISLLKPEFELLKLKKIKREVTVAKIPPQLIINWDQTGVNVVPTSQWTWQEQGSSQVVAGFGDKHQITITVAGTLSGTLLQFQMLYKSKTEQCHPSTTCTFPEGFDIWHTLSQRANGDMSIWFVKNIILLYM